MKRQNDRQEAIRWIVRNRSIKTQKDLVDELRAEGFACTQATASRDISEMGLRKLPAGVYVLAEDLRLQRMVSEFVTNVECINNQVIIKTQPGTAAGVAAAVDAARLSDVLGSIAGNDTILAITRANESATATTELLGMLCKRGIDEQ